MFDTGSSLATCWRKPNLEYSRGEHELTEGCCLVNGGVSFGFGGDGWHAMEAVQCMVERRKGGESGVTTPHRFYPSFALVNLFKRLVCILYAGHTSK